MPLHHFGMANGPSGTPVPTRYETFDYNATFRCGKRTVGDAGPYKIRNPRLQCNVSVWETDRRDRRSIQGTKPMITTTPPCSFSLKQKTTRLGGFVYLIFGNYLFSAVPLSAVAVERFFPLSVSAPSQKSANIFITLSRQSSMVSTFSRKAWR